jgi:hypothetical protein
VIATIPVGQAPQGVAYVPAAVPSGEGLDSLQPKGAAAQSTQLRLLPPGGKSATQVTLFNQGLVRFSRRRWRGWNRRSRMYWHWPTQPDGSGKLEPIASFMTNPAGAAIVRTEGIRVMTVHKAKGLEFPIVILADPTCPATHDKPSRHVDPERQLWLEPLCGCTPSGLLRAADDELLRERGESVRVAYVASTRARDLLVVPGCGDSPISGWLDVLNPVLYPLDHERSRPETAIGCPTFGEDSVLDRGDERSSPPGGPGLRVVPSGLESTVQVPEDRRSPGGILPS